MEHIRQSRLDHDLGFLVKAHIRQSRPDYELGFQVKAHIRQSRPDSGLEFQEKVPKTLQSKGLETLPGFTLAASSSLPLGAGFI